MRPGSQHSNKGALEFIRQWLSLARRVGEAQKPRRGKTVFTGEASHIPVAEREDFPVFATFEVTERTIDKHGQDLLIPDIEVNTF